MTIACLQTNVFVFAFVSVSVFDSNQVFQSIISRDARWQNHCCRHPHPALAILLSFAINMSPVTCYQQQACVILDFEI